MKVYVAGKNDSIQHVFATKKAANAWLIYVQLEAPQGSYMVDCWVKEFEVID